MHNFQENILERPRNFSETTPEFYDDDDWPADYEHFLHQRIFSFHSCLYNLIETVIVCSR